MVQPKSRISYELLVFFDSLATPLAQQQMFLRTIFGGTAEFLACVRFDCVVSKTVAHDSVTVHRGASPEK